MILNKYPLGQKKKLIFSSFFSFLVQPPEAICGGYSTSATDTICTIGNNGISVTNDDCSLGSCRRGVLCPHPMEDAVRGEGKISIFSGGAASVQRVIYLWLNSHQPYTAHRVGKEADKGIVRAKRTTKSI
ncbi:MAG: hypothetical protein KKI15_19390 [Proteobacteria bacterium]|nr:hypothetical protein [Pseudomonadota bacterium]MBU1420652.1 hypothetical protein [Pseudomonadota bacterium]